MSGVQCGCGWFLAHPTATAATAGEGYSWRMYLADIRGDCSRCGPDAQASRNGPWWDWDLWKWPEELLASA